MADSDLSLLFRLRGDASSLLTASAQGRASVAQLKQAFGPELTATVTVANRAFGELTNTLQGFVTQRVPVASGIINITDALRRFGVDSKAAERAAGTLANTIASISQRSGRSVPQISQFLGQFVKLEGQAKRNEAAFNFFGGSVDLIGNKTARFIPELEKAGAELAAVSKESAGAGAAIGGMVIPVAAAVIAVAALVAGVAVATRELIQLTRQTAEFQGRMFDLSQATGLGVETLSTFEVAAKTTGGSLDSVAASLGIFQRHLEESRDPMSKAADTLRELGVTSTDTEVALRQTLAALAAMPEGATQTATALELFGRGGRQVLAILKETNGDLDALTKRLRDAGVLITTDTARAADILNDELALLDFQIRAAGAEIVRELIPALADAARNLTEVVRASRPLLEIFSRLAGPVARTAADSLKGLSIVVKALTLDYEGLKRRIREVNEEAEKSRDIPALSVPDVQLPALPGQPGPSQAAQQAVATTDVIVASAKRAASEINQTLNAAFEQGRIDRQQQAEETIAANARILDAERKRVEAQLKLKDEETRQLQRRDDISAAEKTRQLQKLNEDVQKLQQEQLNAESLFETTSREIRSRAAKERADSQRNEERNRTNTLLREFDRQIADIEAQIARGEVAESTGLTTIEAIEQAKIDARRESLEEQKRIGFLSIADQKEVNDQIQQLNQEADRLQDEQRNRRLQRERGAFEQQRQQKISEIESLLEAERIAGESLIARVQAQAALRIRSEEDAAREIKRIRLELINDEIEAVQAQQRAARTIVDVNQRTQTETELNNRLRILKAQRLAIESQGNRDIATARQEDIDNEQRYAEEVRDIQERIIEIERDAAADVIRLMILHGARRKDIIRAQRELDLQEEEDRHRRVTESIRAQEQEVDEQIKVLERHLEVLKVGTQEEIEQHDRLIAKLEALRLKREELRRQQEAEDQRNQTRKRRVTKESEDEEKEADPLDRFKITIDDIKKISREVENAIVPLGNILRDTFLQVADAVGQVVSNYVLLGTTGPAVMRKILAVALASIAAEAAVNAIKELALGFATLFFNPAESAGHFTAAALWGSIAGVSAVAGRAVAGNLFQQGAGSSGGISSEGRSGGAGSSERDPIDLIRNQQREELHIFVHAEPGGRFNDAIVAASIDNIRLNGQLRDAVVETTGA